MKMQAPPAAAAYRIVVEKDVAIRMRDGARLIADVFRPDDAGKFPAIMNLGPYQKDKLWVPPETLEEKPNPYMNWETVNPEWWVPKGYAAVRVDGRGSGKSPGQCEPWSLAEAVDFYDAIEWAAAQPWCNGKVGLSGISYYAINQWFVANLQPPSLAAIIPWEGFADLYRDALFHGGILSVFMPNWFVAHMMHHLVGRASLHQPNAWQINTLHFWLGNSLDSGAFRAAQAQWERITQPLLTRRQLVRHGAASARQHRGLRARRLQAQEAADARRHARAPVLHRGRPARSAALLRLLAQGHRQRRHGRAAGEACDPQGPRPGRVARRARVAACAHAVDQILFRSLADRARPGAANRNACTAQPRRRRIVHLCGDQPRLHGFDLRGVLASDGRRHQARHGRRAGNPAARGGYRSHRTGCRELLGVELDRGHGCVPHAAQHRRRRPRGSGDRPAGHAGAGGEGLAAGLAPRARSGPVVAVPPLSQARAAALP